MKALLKTLVGDTRTVAGVTLIVAVAAGLTALHRPDWAAYVTPAVGLAVVFWLAGR